MASPIFVSNPRAGYSLKALLRGIQIALLSAYRSIQGPFWHSSNVKTHASCLLYSILAQLCLCTPLLGLKFLSSMMNYVHPPALLLDLTSGMRYLLWDVFHLPVVTVSAAAYFCSFPDDAFLKTLEFYEQKTNPLKDISELSFAMKALPLDEKETTQFPPSFEIIYKKYTSSEMFLEFSQRIIATLISNILIFAAHKLPLVGSLTLGLISFQVFNDIIGTDRAVVLFLVIQVIPHNITLAIITYYWGCKNLTHDLLKPFFARVRFTNRERQQWLKSRGGPLLGFGIFYFMLINRYPWVSFVLYNIASSSMAYFLTKLSDAPPSQSNRLIDWNVSQLLWSKEQESAFLNGGFVTDDEVFLAVPFSSLFDLS